MKIAEITPKALRESSKTEINSLHRRLHQLWGANFKGNAKDSAGGKLARGDLINCHTMITKEMERRDMKHDSPINGLPRKKMAVEIPDLPDEIVVVPQFVSIVGSTARGDEDASDLDVLIRTEEGDDKKKMVIWADSVILPLRKVLDPDKKSPPHWLLGPTGPHAENVPLYDLVLRRIETRTQQAAQPGLYLVEPHAEMIWKGEKKAVIKSRPFDVAGKRYVLVSDGKDGKAWGMIELHEAKVITLDEFKKLRDEHRVTEDERIEWWSDYDKLYYHDIKYFTPYDQPKKVSIPQGVQTFVKDVKLAEDAGGPVKVDLGCGENKARGHIGVDERKLPGVDIVHNLNMGLPFPDDYADEIRAHHILEHLHDPVFSMYEIWRVLKPDGILDVAVPSTKGEGAFAHPRHTSFWNKTSFYFYCESELRKEIDFPGKFEILWLEEIERGDAVDVRGRLKAVKEAEQVVLAVSPWYTGPLPKPSQRYTTDFFSTDELWGWAEKRAKDGLAVEEKLGGWRALVQKKGNNIRIEFEDTRRDVSGKLPSLVKALKKFDKDVILDANLGIQQGGKPWPRVKLMTLAAKKPVIPESAHVLLTAFDVLYDGEDVTELPLSERRKRLEAVVKAIGDKHVAVSQQAVVKTKATLEEAAKKLAGLPGSEGVVVKEWESKYPKKRATQSWAKLKHSVEILAWVLDTKKTKSGAYNFRGGLLLGSAKFENVVDFRGRKVVDLGYSYNAGFSAKRGDIISFEVEEIILQADGKSLAWLGAKPISKETRKEPYYAKQVVGMAKRGHILQDARVQQAKQMEEGETRGARSATFWKEHWHELMPMSGKGHWIYQRHWRGLSEEESKLSEEELLKTEHSVHGDLRCSFGPALFGFTIYTGKTSDIRGGRTLATLPHDDGLQCAPKLSQPSEWLTVAKPNKPFIVGPGGPGSTSKSWSAFFRIDGGNYEIGIAHRSFLEIWLRGDKIKGRYLIQKAQAPEGRRYWQIVRAKSQKAYADEHDKNKELARLKGRGHKTVYWSRPGEKLEKIDLTKWEAKPKE